MKTKMTLNKNDLEPQSDLGGCRVKDTKRLKFKSNIHQDRSQMFFDFSLIGKILQEKLILYICLSYHSLA